jgi:16S rRNA (cytosine967-C5)-methyltransferase
LNKQALNKTKARVIAHQAICLIVLKKRPLSEEVFPEDAENLPFAKSLTFGSIRFYHHLNELITVQLNKPIEKKNLDIHCLLILGAYQLVYANTPSHAAINETVSVADFIGKSWAKGLINAVLRKINSEKISALDSSNFSHPSWLIKKLKQDHPKHYKKILEENNKQAPMTIRVHPSINIEKYQRQLEEKSIRSKPSRTAPQALILEKPVDINLLPGFVDGSCFIQDASAQLAGHLLNPKEGESILDACCAPGGKTTHLAELCSKATIMALDNDNKRLSKVSENIARYKQKNINIQTGDARKKDWWNGQLFDKILIDAPCSGTGVIRRHPDIKLLRKPKDINKLIETQASILNNLWTILEPGGLMIYATCSVLTNENERQIKHFLNNTNDANIEQITMPWGDGSLGKQKLPEKEYDGFYYAKIIKSI